MAEFPLYVAYPKYNARAWAQHMNYIRFWRNRAIHWQKLLDNATTDYLRRLYRADIRNCQKRENYHLRGARFYARTF